MFEVSGKKVYVINLLGEYGMHIDRLENPFSVMGRLLNKGLPAADAIIVDFHAETTSEKVVMGWYLDGKVSAVLGTHTHVPTADTRLLAKGTAYVTDVGMVGLRDSSLGVDKDLALQRFLTGTNVAFEIPDHGIVAVNAVLMTFTDGRAVSMERIYREVTV
jgi:metallophosphoesterase (TIGR00282 family)